MTKQVFELFSDATVLSDIHSLGAVIIRIKDNSSLPTYLTLYKCLFIFEASDSSQAELLAGLHGLSYLMRFKNIGEISIENSRWIMDLPHIDSIIKKQMQDLQKLNAYRHILDLITENKLEIKLPIKGTELEKHHLCHRMCTLGRRFYSEKSSLDIFFANFSSHLKKINSNWIINDENIQENSLQVRHN